MVNNKIQDDAGAEETQIRHIMSDTTLDEMIPTFLSEWCRWVRLFCR